MKRAIGVVLAFGVSCAGAGGKPSGDPPRGANSPHVAQHSSAASPGATAALKDGDPVFGQWTDGNWYPGKIAKLNADGTYAVNYNGVPIPSPDTRPDLAKPVIYWTPVIAPGNLIFYNGAMFPEWRGSALVSGLSTMSLNRIAFDNKGAATPAERWRVGFRVRDVEIAPDGSLWLIEDKNPGGL